MDKKLIAGGTLAGLIAVGGVVGMVSAQTAAEATGLTEAQAIEIALMEIAGDVQETELESEDGIQVYEIEIVAEDGTEHEVEIDANTGEVLTVEAEGKDGDCARKT